MKREHPGHRARQKDVREAELLNIELCEIYNRMRKRKDCPVWLTDKLNRVIIRSNMLLTPLMRHRDELPQYLKETV